MSVRFIKNLEGVRDHRLDDRKVHCPNALDWDRQTRYGVHTKRGDWITWTEGGQPYHGRVLGRAVPDARLPGDPEGPVAYISVVGMSNGGPFAYIRWVRPDDVEVLMRRPPRELYAFLLGELPKDPTMVYRLSQYGTLAESYIGQAPGHIEAWTHGVSPAAYGAGVRICSKCGEATRPASDGDATVRIGPDATTYCQRDGGTHDTKGRGAQ